MNKMIAIDKKAPPIYTFPYYKKEKLGTKNLKY